MEISDRPKVGFALSGSGSRLVFYIGFLETLAEKKVPIDYIAAMSGASIVAAAFSCGTLNQLKRIVFSLTKEKVAPMLPKGNGGVYSLDIFEDFARKYVTEGKNFEDVRPLLGFVASDIETGEQVVLSMGDIARAGRISCTLPFYFEAVKWGERTLIDGGLLNRIPVDVVKQAGMDIIVGVNMRGTPHLFTDRQLAIKRAYNFFKKALMIEFLEQVWGSINIGETNENENESEQAPSRFSVLGKSMDLAILAAKNDSGSLNCDLMITPDIMPYRLKNILAKRQELYELGKKSASENALKIFDLINKKTAL